ncbi:MAG: TldD/PmbA family protein [Candidatus Thorarchaeota archaeon]|nr:TldD/PmbA family protein [Candidatus Thorarchaeota archaeon]
MEVSDVAAQLVSKAEKAGASQAEAYVAFAKTSSIYIDDNIPKISDKKDELGVGLKYILGKKIGFTSSTLLSETMNAVVERAKSMAENSAEDPRFVSLPDPKKASGNPTKFYDSATGAAEAEVLLDHTMNLVNAAVARTVGVPNGVLRTSSIEFHTANSLGVDAWSKSSMVFGYFTAKAENNGAVGEGVQRCWSQKLGNIDFSKIGAKLQSQALDVIRAEPFKDKWENIVAVLAPSEGSEMLGSLVEFTASADFVNRKSSPWSDKVGDAVAHESVNIVDNGLSEKGLLSGIIDDEGTPTQKTPIIEKGLLKSYFFDSYNANIVGLASTGNGIRRNPRDAQGSFSSPTRCSPTTLEIPTSGKSYDELIGEVDKGIYVEHFAYPLVDPFTGAFSNEIRNGCLIENGELTTKVKYALLVGNLFESLNKEVLFSAEPEVHGNRVMPTMAFSGAEIVGQ